jgi:putative transposase
MPRRARISIPGIPRHIIQRGNNCSACFYADEDNQFYLDRLKEQSEKHDCKIHAHVVMTNHVYLLLTPR